VKQIYVDPLCPPRNANSVPISRKYSQPHLHRSVDESVK
jgi:hypothetical protein